MDGTDSTDAKRCSEDRIKGLPVDGKTPREFCTVETDSTFDWPYRRAFGPGANALVEPGTSIFVGTIDFRRNEIKWTPGMNLDRSQGDVYRSINRALAPFDITVGSGAAENEDDKPMWSMEDRPAPSFDISEQPEQKTGPAEALHQDQMLLTAFEDAKQGNINPDSDKLERDDRLKDLPAFLGPSTEPVLPDRSIYDPNTGQKHECDACGGEDPWIAPAEAGVDAVRPGSARDGNPKYDHCDPELVNLKSCDDCRCPFCDAKSIRHRKTKSPTFQCNNCETEFDYPVKYDSDMAGTRQKLYWWCRHCGNVTRAPFRGIPEQLLQIADKLQNNE